MNLQSNSPDTPQNLPQELIQLVLLLVFTHFSTLLINQPPAYWVDSQYVNKALPFHFLLQAGPWTFMAIAILYMFILWLLLKRVNGLWGLGIAAIFSLPHSLGFYWTFFCGWKPIYEAHTAGACSAYRETAFAAYYVIFTLIVFGSRLPAWLSTWTRRLLFPIAVILVAIQGYGLFISAFPPSSPWRPLVSEHLPGPRSGAAIAYDTLRQRAILFGGVGYWNGNEWVYDNSTWEWDGQDWIQINTPVSPSGRTLHAMAYDEKRQKVVMYGGQNAGGYLADLWEYDGTTWRRLCPVCNPAARYGHKMFFDLELQMILLYGGQNDEIGYTEAWTWNGAIWGYYSFETSAPGIFNEPLIHISDEQRALSFIPGDYGGTWVWKDASWSRLSLESQPPLRGDAILVRDPYQESILLFGGIQDNSTLFNDTWILKGNVWTQIETSRHPQERYRSIAFYDPIRKSIILYGGEAFGDVYGDMWEFLPTGDAAHE